MALIQINVDDDVCRRADAAFAYCGITTPMAVKMMVTQVAKEGWAPFDGLFADVVNKEFAEDVLRDMVYVEAVELGLVREEPAKADPTQISDDVLTTLGISMEEIGQ